MNFLNEEVDFSLFEFWIYLIVIEFVIVFIIMLTGCPS